jgi:hypothetical protein
VRKYKIKSETLSEETLEAHDKNYVNENVTERSLVRINGNEVSEDNMAVVDDRERGNRTEIIRMPVAEAGPFTDLYRFFPFS